MSGCECSTCAEHEAEVQRLQKVLREQEEMSEAQSEKFRGCPHAQQDMPLCACSYDKKDDVCEYHAPQLREARAEVQRLREQVRVLREALEPVTDEEWEQFAYDVRIPTPTNFVHAKMMEYHQLNNLIASRAIKVNIALAQTEPRP